MEPVKIEYKNFYYPPGGILMWIIIFLELITFGMALVAMVYYGKLEADIFHASRLHLNTTIGTINTIFLITSGLFMANSVGFLKEGNITKASLFIKLTMLGGLLFLGLKGFEYFEKIEAGLTMGKNTFFTFYWLLTLFHVIHVLVGLVILGSVYHGLKKNGSEVKLEDVEASAAFWHMCDLIW
ncbi:MAG: cytochrome c oxidase subunit 3, partial [Flavobacteriaceae bacterium]